MPLHRIQFFLTDPLLESRSALAVSNISTSGIALIRDDGSHGSIQPGSTIRGEVEINSQLFPTQIEVRHLTNRVIGGHFLMPKQGLDEAIRSYFASELIGLCLNLVDSSILKKEESGTSYWLTDGRQNEVYIHWDKGLIQHFHLTYLGNYIEGSSQKPLRYGYVADETGRKAYKASTLIRLSSEIPEGIRESASKLVLNLRGLPGDVQKELVNSILDSTLKQASSS